MGRHDRELARSAPLLALLHTPRDTPADWLRTGRALQHLLLTACNLGLQGGYLNQPVQVTALRSRLGELTGTAFPQLVLRLGTPVSPPPASPRRPLTAVLEPAPDEGTEPHGMNNAQT